MPKWLVLAVAILAVGCHGSDPSTPDLVLPSNGWQLTSPAFSANGVIPKQYTADGADVSPPLQWTRPPDAAKTLALVVDDPDAPGATFVHWVVWNIPTSATSLPEGVAKQASLPDGTSQGTNGFGKVGWNGPSPPKGAPHRYFFKLYAVDTSLELPSSTTKAQLETAMGGHALAEAQVMGTYGR